MGSLTHSDAVMNIKPIACLFAALLCLAVADRLAAQTRPNLVIVLCDDLGYGDLGCFGHPKIKTTRLDQMAAQGVRLTSFYAAAPVCSPSRVGLLTGRSPNRAGVYDWIPPVSDAKSQRPDNRDRVHLQRDEPTIANLLKKAGYATCMAGKWHCNSRFNHPDQPQPGDAGFDHWFATHNNAAPSHRNPRNFVRNGEPADPINGYSCQIVVNEAIGWLRHQREANPKQPFFLYVAFHEPHEPVASPQELVNLYLPISETREQAEYFANVHNLDLATGRLLDALDDLGVGENTLVVFTSDNGPETLRRYKGAERSYGTAEPLRGMKLWTTEAGFRVPGIARWPGVIAGGQTSDQAVSALDLLPTFCALAGIDPSADRVFDGTDCMPAFMGDDLVRRKPLLWCYYAALNPRQVAMRDGEWKVLARLAGRDGKHFKRVNNLHAGNADEMKSATLTDLQIFKVVTDIGEKNDLSAVQPEQAERLREKLHTAYEELVADSFIWRR